MFTGIVEATGTILEVQSHGSNRTFRILANLDEELRIDQSISHDGVCLTVEKIFPGGNNGHAEYQVTAVRETLSKTNLGMRKQRDKVNIERCLRADSRIEGHFVQGHVDCTGNVESIEDQDGSLLFRIGFDPEFGKLIVPKGSICVSGVSLTVVETAKNCFSVAIIPITMAITTFKDLKVGNQVNLEFDILGKYILSAAASGFNSR